MTDEKISAKKKFFYFHQSTWKIVSATQNYQYTQKYLYMLGGLDADASHSHLRLILECE